MDISVIIPCYNSSKTIIESINSVVEDCCNSPFMWEIIVIDDGSKDDSLIKIKRYIESSTFKENFILIEQTNSGASEARNQGLIRATGKYIAFNDSDDKWLKGKIKMQIDYLNANPDIYLLEYKYDDDDFNKGSFIKLNDCTEINIKNQVMKNYFSPPTVILRHEVINIVGLFNSKVRYSEEVFFFINIVAAFKSVYMNKRVAVPVIPKKRWGESGLSGNLWEMEKGEIYSITHAYKSKYISLFRYIYAIIFSYLKYIRRVIIKTLRK